MAGRRWSYTSSSGAGKQNRPGRKRFSLQIDARKLGRKSIGSSNTSSVGASTIDDSSHTGAVRSNHVERPAKSCMKVKTVEESLSKSRGNRKIKKTHQASRRRNNVRQSNSSEPKASSSRDVSTKIASISSPVNDASGLSPAQIKEKGKERENNVGPSDFRKKSMMKMKSSSCNNSSMGKLFSASARKIGESVSLRALLGRHDLGEETGGEQKFINNVRFDTVEIREYTSDISDNPEVMDGPGVALGWEYCTVEACSLDKYEETRGPRMEMHELLLSDEERKKRLLGNGVSREDLRAAMKNANRARSMRMKTIQSKTSFLEEKLEGATNKFKKVMKVKRSQEEEEDKLWSEAQLYFAAY